MSTKAGCFAIAEQVQGKETKVGLQTLHMTFIGEQGYSKQVDTLVNCAGVVKPWPNPVKDHNDRTSISYRHA